MLKRYCYTCGCFIEHKRLKKWCRICLDIRKDGNRLITPTDSENERTPSPSRPLIIEDRRIINRTIEVNLLMLHALFKERYSITEDIQDIFNWWIKWTREIGSGKRD